jgi:membrane associated rhomboid family serine protease
MTVTFLIVVLMVFGGGVAYGATNAGERKRLLERTLRVRQQLLSAAPLRHPQIVAFWELLCERTPFAPVTPALVGVNVAVFVAMLFGTNAIDSPDTIIAWGGSFGPRTANGEWWRLVTTLFVHVGVLHLLAEMAGLLAVGLLLERLVGPLVFAVVYIAAGMSSVAFNLVASPAGMSVGASGAVFGLYGLMLASTIRGVLQGSTPRVPLALARYVAPAAAGFGLYSLLTDAIASGPELSSLLMGCLSGLLVARGILERPVPAIRTAPIAVAAVVMIVFTVRPLSGMTDMRPEIHRLVTAEQEMAARYQKAIDRFRIGRITDLELAEVIDHDIIPELQASRARVASLEHVPDDQRPLLAAAEKYLQLRDESWRIRSRGLNVGSVSMLKQADMADLAALVTLRAAWSCPDC